MTSLLERATPELKKAIAVYGVDFPYTAKLVQEDLEANEWVAFLRYSTVVNLGGMARAAGWEFDLSDPWKYFSRA